MLMNSMKLSYGIKLQKFNHTLTQRYKKWSKLKVSSFVSVIDHLQDIIHKSFLSVIGLFLYAKFDTLCMLLGYVINYRLVLKVANRVENLIKNALKLASREMLGIKYIHQPKKLYPLSQLDNKESISCILSVDITHLQV